MDYESLSNTLSQHIPNHSANKELLYEYIYILILVYNWKAHMIGIW